MPAERLKMRRVRDILRYRFEDKLGHKSIALRVGAAPSTVRETLRRVEIAGLSWPLGEDISDAVLEAALYKAAGTKTGHRRSAELDWAHVHRELKRKHVTLQILETNISAFILTGIAIAALSWLGPEAAGDDAPRPCGRRKALCRLCRRHDLGSHRSTIGENAAKPICSLLCSGYRAFRLRMPAGAKRFQIGSNATCWRLRLLAGLRHCSSRTMPRWR